MTPNMGVWDRGIRAIVGIAVIAWGVWAGTWWGVLGAIFLLTALIGSCPAYLPFGFNSRKTS